MTPLRTADAIATLAPPPTWTSVTGKPSTFAPSAHTHTLADLTQSSATSGQVPTWNGTAWVASTPSTPSSGAVSYTALTNKPTLGTAAATDSTDYATAAQGATADTASQPGHTHSIADVSNLQTELNSKQASGSYAALGHTHSAAELISGTLSIGRIPTGTTSSTVCLGNDSRLSDSRTPTSHTHGNLTATGAIGTTSSVPIITGTGGVLAAGTFGTATGTFCQGNDSRLLNLTGGITTVAVVATMPATPSSTTLYIVTG